MNDNAITPNQTRLGVFLKRLTRQANATVPRKSVGVLTSYTTEGVVRRTRRVDEGSVGTASNVPRWG